MLSQSNYISYANGKFLRRADIMVSVNDLVLLRGYAVFDFLRTYNHVPFCAEDYVSRFFQSAKYMKLRVLLNEFEVLKIIFSLVEKNKKLSKHDFGIRLLLTGGYSLDAFLPAIKPNLFILIEDLPQYPDWWQTKGIKLITSEHARELPVVKTTNYLTAIRLAEERRKNHAQDTLYCYKGKVLETTRNNFFLFKNNTLVTAKHAVLQGITRSIVLDLAKKHFKIEVRDVKVGELKKCAECFITGTTRGITPVVNIDGKKVGDGKIGHTTRVLMQLFSRL